jgi:PAS domain-containing protein
MINTGIAYEKATLNGKKQLLASRTQHTSSLTIILSIIAIGIIMVAFVSNVLLNRKRRWLEGFLESILNTSQNGIVTYKAVREQGKIVDLKVEFANAAIQNLLGIDPVDAIVKDLATLTL